MIKVLIEGCFLSGLLFPSFYLTALKINVLGFSQAGQTFYDL
jgi:hypothetical protein